MENYFYFPTQILYSKADKFLPLARSVVEKELSSKNFDFNFSIQTGFLANNLAMAEFNDFILNTCWNLLNDQGYNVTKHRTLFTEHWIHYHPKFSYVEKHRHGLGSQLTGIYVLKSQSNKMRIYDPRNGVSQMLLSSKADNNINYATDNIFFNLQPGDLFIFNSWLEHSIDRNESIEPLIFLHFNISVARE